jgi:Mg2+ and Co2+ transporter CorA
MTQVQYKLFEFIYTSGLAPELENTLLNDFGLNEVDVEDIYSDTQLSKFEIRQDYIYIALQFPIFDKAKQGFLIKDLHCFCSPNQVIIIDRQNYKHFTQFINFQDQLLEDEEFITPGLFVAELLDFCMTKTYKAIMKFKADIAQVESDLFAFMDDIDVLKDILTIKKNLVNFESVITPIQRTIRDLEAKNENRFSQEELERLDNSLDTINKIMNNLKNFQDQIDILMATNDSMMIRSTSLNSKNILLTSIFGFLAIFGLSLINSFRAGIIEGNWLFIFFIVVLTILIVTGFYFTQKNGK